MGDAEGQSSLNSITIFLDENHSGNQCLHAALRKRGVLFERHLDHFPRGIDDTAWIPVVASREWVILTSDGRIRYNYLEKEAVRENKVRFFYFTRNDIGGAEMGSILAKALPKMLSICKTQSAPFIASISRSGEVHLRETFDDG